MSSYSTLKIAGIKFFNKLFPLSVIFISLILTSCGGGASSTGATNNGGGTAITPPGSGTQIAPSQLLIETLYSGSADAAGTVYYSFTTGSRPMAHLIDLDNISSGFGWTLSTQADFSTALKGCYQSWSDSDCQTNILAANTTYYLKLQSYATTKTNYTIRVNRILASEGSSSSPVQLTVGSAYEGTLPEKIYTSSSSESFYTFTTGSIDSTYTIILSGARTDVRWMLYSDGFSTGVRDCDDIWQVGNESCTTTAPLTANTMYYLKVENRGTQSSFFNIDITPGGTHVNTYTNQGSVLTPATLTTGGAQAGTISPQGTSYYKFNTNSKNANYVINLGRVAGSYQFYLYSDSSFTTQVGSVYYGSGVSFFDRSWRTIILDANSTFYLKIVNYSNLEDKFEITPIEDAPQNANSEGTTITPITLTPGITYSGTVGNASNSYYKFTIPEAKPYQISLTNGQTDLSWTVTSEFNNYMAPSTICEKVRVIGDEICTVRKTDAGRTQYLYVSNNNQTLPSTFNITISVVEGQGEGTIQTPITLTRGTPYSSSLGGLDKTSYYQFTTGAELAKYRISVTGATTETAWVVYEINGNSSTSVRCEKYDNVVSNMICETGLLTANKAHSFQVTNKGAVATPITVSVSTGTPIQMITLDTPLLGQSYDGYSNNTGYYKFTTGAAGTSYTFQMTGFANKAHVSLFQDQTYSSSGYLGICETPSALLTPSVSCTINALSPSTTYYLRTYIIKNSGITDSFDFAVLNDSYAENSITLALGVSYQGKVASKSISSSKIFSTYQFTTAGGGPKNHRIALSGPSGYCVRLYSDLARTAWLAGACSTLASVGTPLTLDTSGTLKASTTYYFEVEETEKYSNKFTLTVN